MMRRALQVNGGRVVSSLVEDDASRPLTVGMLIAFDREVSLPPHGVVPKGTKGTVLHLWDSGAADIGLEALEPRLVNWDNILTIAPFDTPALTEAIRVKRRIPGRGCLKVVALALWLVVAGVSILHPASAAHAVEECAEMLEWMTGDAG